MMTDGTIDLPDLAANADDEELVFDDEVIAAPQAAPQAEPSPEPAPEHTRPRRTPRRGRAVVEDAPREQSAPREEPRASAAAEPAMAEEPAGPPAPVPQPDVGPAGFDRRDTMLLAIVVLALFTSLVSLGGLIAVGRTLAQAQADRARAGDERGALIRVPAIVKTLDDASARLALAASRQPASGPPATVADVKQALDDLRLALVQHQPDGLTALNGMTRDGLSEIGTRLDRISAQINGVRAAPVPSRPMRHTDGDGQ